MAKIADLLGFGPKREYQKLDEDHYRVTVTPPEDLGFEGGSPVILSNDQFERYQMWLSKRIQIQSILPDLSPESREYLLSGLCHEDLKNVNLQATIIKRKTKQHP